MEKLAKYIQENNVEYSDSCIKESEIKTIENVMEVKFGSCLTEYLSKYGYLSFGFVELYGVTKKQGLNSDLVRQTLYLHRWFPNTVGLIAIDNQGEGDYFLVNSEDKVFEYDSELDMLYDTKINLEEYILNRFKSEKQMQNN